MLWNLASLMLYLAALGALGSIPLILWLGAAIASTARATAPRRPDLVTT